MQQLLQQRKRAAGGGGGYSPATLLQPPSSPVKTFIDSSISSITSAFSELFIPTNSEYINICIVGCVNAGKSTILNAFFGNDYAECKIKRSTMIPNIFIETDITKKITPQEEINQLIKHANKQIYDNSIKGEFRPEEYENELTFYVENMNLNVGSTNKICIYDIPGLNDVKTAEIYYNYLEKNFHKFNIVLFVVDINSGLNTTDELRVLEFFTDNIKKHKEHSNKNIKLLTIVNKADYMQLSSEGELMIEGELGEMFEQTKIIVNDMFRRKNIREYLLGCIPICGLNAHLCRMIERYRDVDKLTRDNIIYIGSENIGKNKFCRLTEPQQKAVVQDIISDEEIIKEMIKMSGFTQIENAIKRYITSSGGAMIAENILFEYNKIEKMTFHNMDENFKLRVKTLIKIKDHNRDLYLSEFQKIIKDFNTLIYKMLAQNKNPYDVVGNYNMEISRIITNDINVYVREFVDLSIYPKYVIDLVMDLIVKILGNQQISIQGLELFKLIMDITQNDIGYVDNAMDKLLNNPNKNNTIAFVGLSENSLISILEQIKNSTRFIEFLRFLLINLYYNHTTPEQLVMKKMLFKKYTEIPLYECIGNLLATKNITDISIYTKGISANFILENSLEIYYIAKCREFGDIFNFDNHSLPLE